MSAPISDEPTTEGGPTTSKNPYLGFRSSPEITRAVDHWIARQPEPKPTRTEAIRRLVTKALQIEAHPSLDQQIATVKEQLAVPDVESGPSPEAGMEALRRGLAENELRTLKQKRRRSKPR
jgi:hypothetical protein